jgi:hypothetical protein
MSRHHRATGRPKGRKRLPPLTENWQDYIRGVSKDGRELGPLEVCRIVALTYKPRAMDLDEAISIAAMAAVNTARRHDPTRPDKGDIFYLSRQRIQTRMRASMAPFAMPKAHPSGWGEGDPL